MNCTKCGLPIIYRTTAYAGDGCICGSNRHKDAKNVGAEMNNRIESCNFEAGAAPEPMSISQEELIAAPVGRPEPVGEEVEVVGYATPGCLEILSHTKLTGGVKISGVARERYTVALMTVTQHLRLIEEAKHGQRVLVHEVEQLKAQLQEAKMICSVARIYSPNIYKCAHCGYPVASGYCCTSCNSANPRGDRP